MGLGHVLYMRREYVAAEPIYQRALTLEEAARGKDKTGSILPLIALGDNAYCRMEYAKAEPFYRRALAIAEKEAGAESLETANALDHLALLLRQTDRNPDADAAESRAKAIRKKREDAKKVRQ